ncbi:MAG: hypothetical protein LBH28_11045 [Oscillospiraceae bacterium]|jgi:hypothetical protein|nr:hypothetical protein [Oscillospiraceae bacterium]
MDDDGHIVVETLGAFVPFVLLIVSILSLVNIVTLQTRVHYALTQAANTLSMYCYTLEVTGLADGLQKLDSESTKVRKAADEMKTDVAAVFSGIESLSIGAVAESGEAVVNRAIDWGESIADDPKGVMQLLLNYALSESGSYIFGQLVRPLVGRYLANSTMTGDSYLKSVNVVNGIDGLDFYEFTLFNPESIGNTNSVLLDRNGDVRLIVQYDIEYKFGSLPLPFRPTLHVTQSVATKAWLGGKGKGYW